MDKPTLFRVSFVPASNYHGARARIERLDPEGGKPVTVFFDHRAGLDGSLRWYMLGSYEGWGFREVGSEDRGDVKYYLTVFIGGE